MRNPNLTVSKEPAPTGSEWYLVQDVRNEARLWIVEHDPQTDLLTCTCERTWCDHQEATTREILDEYARQDQADRLDMSRGQF